jgi:hypothetical protein
VCVDLSPDRCGSRVRALVSDCFGALDRSSAAGIIRWLLISAAVGGEGTPWTWSRASPEDTLFSRDSGAGTDMADTANAARGRRACARGGILLGSVRGDAEACKASTCGDSLAPIRSTDWRGGSPEATTRALFLGLRGLLRNVSVTGSSARGLTMSAAFRDRGSEDWVVDEAGREISGLSSDGTGPSRAPSLCPGSTATLAGRR